MRTYCYHWLWESNHACMQFPKCSESWASFPPWPILVGRIQTLGVPEDYRQELGYFEVVGVVFRTVVVAVLLIQHLRFRWNYGRHGRRWACRRNRDDTAIPCYLVIIGGGSLGIERSELWFADLCSTKSPATQVYASERLLYYSDFWITGFNRFSSIRPINQWLKTFHI